MPGYLANTISALSYELAAMYGWPECEPPHNDVARFVLEQLDRVPPFLAWGVKAATALFGCSRLLLEGSLFHRRPPFRRRLQVEAWTRSRLGLCRDLMKFYTSLAVLALYSRIPQ